jgi:hypothetical protein
MQSDVGLESAAVAAASLAVDGHTAARHRLAFDTDLQAGGGLFPVPMVQNGPVDGIEDFQRRRYLCGHGAPGNAPRRSGRGGLQETPSVHYNV